MRAKHASAVAARARISPAADAKRSPRREQNFDRIIGKMQSLEKMFSLFAEYEEAAMVFEVAARAAEVDETLAAVRSLFERSDRKAERVAEAVAREANAELALLSFKGVAVRCERATIAAEAALGAQFALDAVKAVVVRTERAATKRGVVTAVRRAAAVEREANAELALFSSSGIFVRADRAFVASEAELGAQFALEAARAVVVRAERAANAASAAAATAADNKKLAAAARPSSFSFSSAAALDFLLRAAIHLLTGQPHKAEVLAWAVLLLGGWAWFAATSSM